MTIPDPIHIVVRLAEIFDKLNIEYMVGGSLASSIYGIPRSSLDVDLIAAVDAGRIDPLTQLLKPEFYIDPEAMHEAIRLKTFFNVIHLQTMFKADIFIHKATAFAREQMTRRCRELLLPEKEVFICSPEDLILEKIRWFRLGGEVSDRQWQDVLGVIKVQGSRLDLNYLKSWAEKLDLSNLVLKVLDESGIKN